ncbi:tyrosyl-DNA phosphodiesterase-domain-containing protein [Phlyctochytrium arcticum]|nr:tyrosyl-DNA phosphodiesterase-domain-containing protein [Phlyctochytrium arcticum]
MSAWSCTACTYRNTNAHSNTCEICESVRAIDLTSDSPIRSHEVQCQGVLIDDEDQDLKLALALSLEVDSPEKSQEMQTKQTLKTNTDLPNNDIGDILILSSKSKSPAPSLSPLATTARKRPRDEEDGIQVGKTIKRQADDGKSNPLQVNFDTTRSSDVIPSAITFGKTKRWNVPFQTYPKGHVSLTYVKGFSRAGFTRFEDLVQKDHLTKAFVSAFQIDDGWLNSKIPMHINLCVARTRFQDVPKDTSQLQVGPTRVFVFPPEGTGYSVMHIKLMILFFGEFVRIVVTSANLVEYDWELLENIVFCQDFGMKIDAVGSQPTPPSQFENDLTNILSEMQAPKQVLNAVGKVDFSTAQITLVPSRPGRFSGDDLYKWGHIRLLQATKPLRDEQLAKDSSFAPNVTYTTSSLGLLKLSWAKELHNSLVGVDPELPSTGESGGSKPGNRSNPLPIRVLYPTKKTVENSVLGAAVCHSFLLYMSMDLYS